MKDVFDYSKKSVNLKKIRAKDIMSDVVVCISEDTLVRQAAHLMLRDRINGLPVINDKKKVVGMLTLADLFKIVDKAAVEHHNDFFKELFCGSEFKAAEIMSRDVLTILPNTTLAEIVSFTVEMKVHTFPVIKNNRLVGIVGKHDVLNAVFSFY